MDADAGDPGSPNPPGSGEPAGGSLDRGWLAERVRQLSDERLRAERDPVALLRTLIGPGERAFVARARHEAVIVFAVGGAWWAATMPVRSRGEVAPRGFLGVRSTAAAGASSRFSYGWRDWSAYVRRSHLMAVSLIGPTDTAATLAQQALELSWLEMPERMVAAALAGLDAQDRAAAEFLLAFAGYAVDEETRSVPVTAVRGADGTGSTGT